MDELDVGGKKYISSKRASELTGYAKDYVGQLLRAGKVSGTRFGRAWYVEEAEILRHAGKVVVPDVPATASATSVIESKPKVVLQRSAKPALAPHMITPAVLPKTWSSIQYIEDTSDLFPSLATTSLRTAPEKQSHTESTAEAEFPVSITRTRVSMEKRVASLVDGIRPRSPLLRVAQPSAVKPTSRKEYEVQKILRPMSDMISAKVALPTAEVAKPSDGKKTVTPLQKTVSVHWSAGSFATAFAVLVFVFGSFASFFLINTVATGNPNALTASSFYGLTDFLELLKSARILEGGVEAITLFYTLLRDSFFVFAKTATDFIINLF